LVLPFSFLSNELEAVFIGGEEDSEDELELDRLLLLVLVLMMLSFGSESDWSILEALISLFEELFKM